MFGLFGRGIKQAAKNSDDMTEDLIRLNARAEGVSAADAALKKDATLMDLVRQKELELATKREREQMMAVSRKSKLDEMIEEAKADPEARDMDAALVTAAARNAKKLVPLELKTAQALAYAGPLKRALKWFKTQATDAPVNRTEELAGISAKERMKRTGAGVKEITEAVHQNESRVGERIRQALESGDRLQMANALEEVRNLVQMDKEKAIFSSVMKTTRKGEVVASLDEDLKFTKDEQALLDARPKDPTKLEDVAYGAAQTGLLATLGAGAVYTAVKEHERKKRRQEAANLSEAERAKVKFADMTEDGFTPEQVDALQKFASLAKGHQEGLPRAMTDFEGARASLRNAGRDAIAAAMLAVQDEDYEDPEALKQAADVLIEHFEKRPAAPPPPEDLSGDDTPFAAPRPAAESFGGGDGGRPESQGEAPPLLDQKRASVRQFQRRFNEISRRIGVSKIAADGVRGSDTEEAVKAIYTATGEDMPADPDQALQRAHEIAQSWFTGDASLRKVQELAVATLGPEALPDFGPDNKWGEETKKLIEMLIAEKGLAGVDPSDGLTVEERNTIYYEFGLGNTNWREQKAKGRLRE